MDFEIRATVYVTKWALTQGIIKTHARIDDDGYAWMGLAMIHMAYWHSTLEEAQAHVRKLLDAKRKSLAKAEAALRTMEADLDGGTFKMVERR